MCWDFNIVVIGHMTFGVQGVKASKFKNPMVVGIEMDASKRSALSSLEDAVLVAGKLGIG